MEVMPRLLIAPFVLVCLSMFSGSSAAQETVQRFNCILDGIRYLGAADMRLQDPNGHWQCERLDRLEAWSLPQQIGPIGSNLHARLWTWVQSEPMHLKQFVEREEVRRLNGLIEEVAIQADLPSALLRSVVSAESGYRVRARSAKGALGLMQMMPNTAGDYGTFTDEMLMDPYINLQIGAIHLRNLLTRYQGRLDLALAAYNAGPEAVRRAGNAVPNIKETQQYVKQILQDLAR